MLLNGQRYSQVSLLSDRSALPSPGHTFGDTALEYKTQSKKSVSASSHRHERWLRFRQFASTHWLYEVAGGFLALACLIAIVAVLLKFNGQEVPTWHYGITLNAIVSLLASIATFSLIIPLTAALGQLKWLWFRRKRRLADFESIENASHGPAGSLFLLFRSRGGCLASIGAFLSVMLLAIGPFVQQIVKTGIQTNPHSDVSNPITNIYNAIPNQIQELNVRAAIMNGLLSTNVSSNQFNIQTECPTGNCTWPLYQTLAVCSSCADVTSHLTAINVADSDAPGQMRPTDQLPNNVTLPLGTEGSGIRMAINSSVQTWGHGLNQSLASIAFPQHLFNLADVFIIVNEFPSASNGMPFNTSSSNSSDYSPYAAECILEFCVQSINATETLGSFSEDLALPTAYVTDFLNMGMQPVFHENGTDYLAQNYTFEYDDLNYTLGYHSLVSLSRFLTMTLTGSEAGVDPSSALAVWTSDVTESMYMNLLQPPHTPDALFSNLAQSMTRAMRMLDSSGGNLNSSESTYTGVGLAYIDQTIIVVEWAWISLPLALWGLVMIFLAIVAAINARAKLPVWKGSVIAALFHGLHSSKAGFTHEEGGEELHRLLDVPSMDDMAEELQVTLTAEPGNERKGDTGAIGAGLFLDMSE